MLLAGEIADIVTGAGYVVAASAAAAGAITARGAASITMGDDAPSVSELYDSAMDKVDQVSNKYSSKLKAKAEGVLCVTLV